MVATRHVLFPLVPIGAIILRNIRNAKRKTLAKYEFSDPR